MIGRRSRGGFIRKKIRENESKQSAKRSFFSLTFLDDLIEIAPARVLDRAGGDPGAVSTHVDVDVDVDVDGI
jgi:hypothetical protein